MLGALNSLLTHLGEDLGFLYGLGPLLHGERGSVSLYGGLGAVPPVESRGKASGGGFAPRKFTHIFTGKSQDFNEMK